MSGYQQWKSCTRKQSYTKREAQERLVLKYARRGRGGSIYHCENCGWWHIAKWKDW